jgi:hypothetical protein
MKYAFEDYVFKIIVNTDGEITYNRDYYNAVEAVTHFNQFVDHGTCRYWREIVLYEPDGNTHTKLFKYPAVTLMRVK